MMRGNPELAQGITSILLLDSPPIALSFVDTSPKNVQTFEGQVPSACTFWRRAESALFYAPAENHFNCPIGAMTMGFDLPPSVQQALKGSIEKMSACGYLSPEEPSRIPVISKKSRGILYGPLKEFPGTPDLILLWLTPRQAMLYGEAIGTCRWTDAAGPGVWGRPACAALPVAARAAQPTLSLGCTGMRTFTEIAEDRMLAVLPGERAPRVLAVLEATVAANETMRGVYEEHKRRFLQ